MGCFWTSTFFATIEITITSANATLSIVTADGRRRYRTIVVWDGCRLNSDMWQAAA